MKILLWVAAVVATVACLAFQNRTGPTYPLAGTFDTARGKVDFTFLRSQEIGSGLPILLKEPVPAGVTGKVRYRRFKSHDAWSEAPMAPGTFRLARRGTVEEVKGVGVELPSLPERAGKYEYLVLVDDGAGERSVTGDRPVYARYKAPVPRPVLLVHILVVFVSMTLALRAGLAALTGGPVRGLVVATIVSLVLGAFVLGPIVQKYAFGVWWSGVPFGYDWTDNKVLVELVAWVGAAFVVARARSARAGRAAVVGATAVTLAVYFIPHSIFGSEYDYTRGAGHGTAG